MDNLIVFAGEDDKLDAAAFVTMMSKIPGASKLNERRSAKEGPRYIYKFNGDSTYVELLGEKYISISGTGDSSLNMALFLQRLLPMPLILFDAGYSFEIELKGVSSIDEIRSNMR